MKRTGMILAVALLFGMSWTSTARATRIWTECEVTIAGMADTDAVNLRLTDLRTPQAFANEWFLGVSPIAKEMLAVALTAMALGSPTKCRVEPDVDPRRLYKLYLKK